MRPPIPSVLPTLALLALVVACSAPDTRPQVEPVSPRTLQGVAPRYQPLLQALADAVEAHEDAVASRIAANLDLRLALDEAREDVEIPTEDARALLAGFQRVIQGRRLIDTLELTLVTRPVAGQPASRVVLRARTRSSANLILRPGGALLRVHRITLTPEGKEGRVVRTSGVGNLGGLALSDGWIEVPLGTFADTIPSNALAARTHWTLDLLAGEILEEGRPYPAQEVQVEGAERVDLAPFLPNAPVDPDELVRYVQRPDVALPPILERTVRIAPERRDEALDLLTPLVEHMVPEQIARLVPSLRWLSRTNAPGRDPLAWRSWLRRRAEFRAATGGG